MSKILYNTNFLDLPKREMPARVCDDMPTQYVIPNFQSTIDTDNSFNASHDKTENNCLKSQKIIESVLNKTLKLNYYSKNSDYLEQKTLALPKPNDLKLLKNKQINVNIRKRKHECISESNTLTFDSKPIHIFDRKEKITCLECDFVFYSVEEFQEHRRKHRKYSEKKYTCIKCSRKFKRKYDCDRHFKFKHQNCFRCKLCKKTFKGRAILKNHQIKTH